MPQRLNKETIEKIDEDNTIVLPTITEKALKRVMTKPKTPAQMEAMKKALEARKATLAKKKEEQAKLKAEEEAKKEEESKLKAEEEAKQKEEARAKRREEEEALIKAGTHTRYKVLPKQPIGRPRKNPVGADKYGRMPEELPEIKEDIVYEEQPKEVEKPTYCEVNSPRKEKPKKERKPRRRRYVSDTDTTDTETPTETETETDTDYDSDYKQKKRIVRREVKKNIKALKKIDEVIESAPYSVGATNPWAVYLERKWK
jgi:hypothetical protein